MTRKPTHQEACLAVSRWFLRLAWCDLAVTEIAGTKELGGGVIDVLAMNTPLLDDKRKHKIEQWKKSRKFSLDRGYPFGITCPKMPRPTVAIAEVKVGAGDLRGDLRAGKMVRRYERQASRCYLAATRDAFRSKSMAKATDREVLADLASRGLPDWWGVVEIRHWMSHDGARLLFDCCTVRNPKAYPSSASPSSEYRNKLAIRAAISLSHKDTRRLD